MVPGSENLSPAKDNPVIALQVDEHFMRLALDQARLAEQAQEVPVGAVVVDAAGTILAYGQNSVLRRSDPSAHAEIMALREAGRLLENYRLPGLTLYVTLEPCTMCLGALFHARVSRVVFGTHDPKTGACGSRLDLTTPGLINYHCSVHGGVLAQECGQVLSEFFRKRRQAAKNQKQHSQQDVSQDGESNSG